MSDNVEMQLIALKRWNADDQEEWVWFCDNCWDDWLWERHIGVNCLVENGSREYKKMLEIQKKEKYCNTELVHFDLIIRQK